MELVKGQKVYYARIFETVGMFEVIDLKIRAVEDTWFTGTEQRTKQAFLFGMNAIGKTVFLDRQQALDLAIDAQEKYKKTHKDKDNEEDEDEEL